MCVLSGWREMRNANILVISAGNSSAVRIPSKANLEFVPVRRSKHAVNGIMNQQQQRERMPVRLFPRLSNHGDLSL